MQLSNVLCAAAALAVAVGCARTQENAPRPPAPDARPTSSSSQPMKVFARLIGGRWKMTTTAGKDTFDTWSWGPGEQSIRSMRVGTLTDGDPWRTVTVYYWHPQIKQVRFLTLSSVMRGVGEGRITFENDTAESVFTLHQTVSPRQLRERWVFDGPDKYHDELSERVREEYELLAGWDRVRVDVAKPDERGAAVPRAPEGTPSELMRPLERFLGGVWASGDGAGADTSRSIDHPRTRTTFEYVPFADAVYARIDVIGPDPAASHATDVYLYHHTGTRALRVLALSAHGPDDARVYEGDVLPADDGKSVAFRLTEHSAAGRSAMDALIDFQDGDTARLQVWTSRGAERTKIVDRVQRRVRN